MPKRSSPTFDKMIHQGMANWSRVCCVSYRGSSKSSPARSLSTACWCLLCILLLSIPRPNYLPNSQRDVVFAIYHPIFKAGDWENIPFFESPALGRYGTDIPLTAETHISWAHQNSIGGFVLPWGGKGSQIEEHVQRGILAARNVEKIKLIFLYESMDRLGDHRKADEDVDFGSSAVYETLVEDFRNMREYFWHPSYFSVNGKPVVVMRSSHKFKSFGRDILSALRRDVNVDLFIVGDECYPIGNQSNPETARNGLENDESVFDAYSAMSMHEDQSVVVGESALEYHRRVSMPVFAAWSSAVPFLPLLTPKYNVYGSKTLPGTPGDFWTQLKDAQSLKYKAISESIGTIYVIRSFNQWFEGSSIEPAKDFGYDYLNVINVAFKE